MNNRILIHSEKRKKILFFINVDWFFISHRLPIALQAVKTGYEVHIVTTITSQSNLTCFKSNSLNVHPIIMHRSRANIKNFFINLVKLIFIINKVKPDLVHAITIKPILISGIIKSIFKDISFVFSISGLGLSFSSSGFFSNIRLSIIKSIYRIALSGQNVFVIFQNNDDMSKIDAICKLNLSSKTIIKGSGVDLKSYIPQYNIIKPPLILFASRLLISKGILEFVEAAKKIKAAKFVVAGMFDNENPDCVDKAIFQSWIDSGLIEYLGLRTNMNEIINKSTMVILPSYYGEGLPKILIEAAACGKPVITTDHPGCRDAVIPGKTGIIIPKKDSDSLIVAINKLISSDYLCNFMGRGGRKLAETKYDINSVISKHLNIYTSLIR